MTQELDVAAVVAGLAARRPAPDDAPSVSRWMLGALAALHSPVYKAVEVKSRLAALGLDDPMGSYLAARAAPLGPVGPELVTATFYGFSPRIVAAHVPAVWERAAPTHVIDATLEGMEELLGRVLGAQLAEVTELAALLAPVADAHETLGRPLAAAWSSVPRTGRPLIDLWLTTTVIRESRGDTHVAVLVAEGIGGIASHLVTAGDQPDGRRRLMVLRGWTEDELDAAAATLRAQGLLDAEGRRTDAARALRRHVEDVTDRRSSEAWQHAGAAHVTRIAELALELVGPVLASGTLLGPVIERLAPRA
jgi:hypothetical protein